MARLLGPDANSRLVYVSSQGVFRSAAGRTATVYSDAAGTILANIATYDGTATPGPVIAGSTLTIDSYSQLPRFWFPDGSDTAYIKVGSGPVTPVNADYDARVDTNTTAVTAAAAAAAAAQATANAALPAAGGALTGNLTVGAGKSVTVQSSYAGGPDEGDPGNFDSTGRLNLESYQRADFNSYGEVIRIYSKRFDSKQMIAWYGPTSWTAYNAGTDTGGDPVGNNKPWFWMGAHYEANDHGSVHGHWSCEIPDTTGALQTRFEIPIWNPVTGVYGMDKGVIKTNAADFNVRCSNGQELRLSASAGNEKPITFSNSSDGESAHRRWKIRATSDAEAGGNAGTNLQVVRYDDTGTLVDSPVAIDRSTGAVSIGGTSGTAGGLSVLRASGVAVQVTSTAASGTIMSATGADATSRSLQADVSGDSQKRLVLYTDGKLEWGSGALARDTNLYRSAADVLKTDDSFHVTGNLRINTTSLGSGSVVVALANASVVPSTNPTGGGVLYAEAGALKWRGSSGTVSVVAPA